jgi:hypothetical protein
MYSPFTGNILKKFLPGLILFRFLFTVTAFCNESQNEDSLHLRDIKLHAEDLIRGERLFYGLVYPDERSVNCAGCHNTRISDTLNWNPDALEISRKYKTKSFDEFAGYATKYKISPEDALMIKGYMDIIAGQGLKKTKPVVTNLILFVLASFLLLFSITDLLVTKKIQPVLVNLTIITLTGSFLTFRLVVDALNVGHSPGYSPDQPIKFSHAVHSGSNGIECLYCHSGAEYSKSAGFPASGVCMNCHLVVRKGTRSGSFEINKLIEAYETNNSVRWVRIFSLPDHAFFSHAQHVSAGEILCQECHGEIEKMDRIGMKSNMTMGWCINCHRTRKIDIVKKAFYSDYKNLISRLNTGEIDSVTVKDVGGTDCMKCHY